MSAVLKMNDNLSDKIGRLGENKFDDLCVRAGLAVSTLLPDRTGKDRLVEFPLAEPLGSVSYDTRPPRLACYVQVKTLQAKNDRFKTRLSVAAQLAQDINPAFFAVLRISDNDEFVDMHLIHIDAEVLAAILKRLRTEQVKGTKHINRQTISFSINKGQKMGLDPGILRDWLATAIGPDMSVYTHKKREQLNELGYDSARFELRIALIPTKIEQVVDGFLGLSELKAQKFETFERRFDIPLRVSPDISEASEVSPHVIRVQPRANDNCTINIVHALSGQKATIEGELHFPAIPGIDPKFLKMLFKTEFFNLTLHYNGLTLQSNEGHEARAHHSLQALGQNYRVLKLLSEGECQITIQPHNSPKEIAVPPCRLDNADHFGWVDRVLRVIDAATELRRLSRAEDTSVALEELMAEEQEILNAHAFMTDIADPTSVKFATKPPTIGAKFEEAPFIFVSAVKIGGELYAYALRATLTPHLDGELIQWVSKKLDPLLIESLGENRSENYCDFTEKVSRISGILNILQRDLVAITENGAD